MANNKTGKDASGATFTYATDDVSSVDYPVFKLAVGTEDAATRVTAGGGVEADALRVTIASDSTGVLSIDDNGSSITVDGTITEVTAVTAIINALPAGTNNIGDVDVLTVIPGTGATNLGKVEDAAHTSGDVGVMMLGVRNDPGTAMAGTTGDYIPLTTNSAGALYVTGAGGGTQYLEDAAHASGDTGTMILTVRKDVAAAPAGTTEDYQPLITDASGKLYTVADVTGPIALSAGETFIGQVGGETRTIRPSITVTAGAYSAGDVVGGRLTLTNAMRVTSGTGVLQDILMTCADGEAPELWVLLFNATTASSIADNAAFAWGAGDHAKLVGFVHIAPEDWITIGGDTVCPKENLGIVVEANATTNIYVYLVTVGTPTFAATTDVSAAFKFLCD